jgi:hypothetical protein
MRYPTYIWQGPYMAAVRETDDTKMPVLIYEAVAAIEQRLLSQLTLRRERDSECTDRASVAHGRKMQCAELKRQWQCRRLFKTMFAPFDIFRVGRNARSIWVEYAPNLKAAMTRVYSSRAGTYHLVSKHTGHKFSIKVGATF